MCFRKEERTCFCRHEEKYFKSIEEVEVETRRMSRDVETRKLSPGQVRSRPLRGQSEISK